MNPLLSFLHELGTKPLAISLAAQLVVVGVAVKSKDKGQLAQSLILTVGLILVITSIALRPPSPVKLLPDVLGTGAALFFLAPAVQSLLKLRQSQKGEKPD